MKPNIKYLILFSLTIFNWLYASQIVAQNFNETLEFADRQLKENKYDLALKTYKRLAFFNKDQNDYYIFNRIGELSLLKGDYETAQFNFGLAAGVVSNKTLKNDFLFKKSYAQILNKKYNFALIDLFSIEPDNTDEEFKLNFYIATCYFGLEKFDKSKEYFRMCIKKDKYAKLDQLFTKKNLYKPSPDKARILSYILPGLGQWYVGNFKDGMNSFIINSGLFALGVYSAINYGVVYSIISVIPWLQRYYVGGFSNAENQAILKRQMNRNNTYDKIIDLIEEK
ncbi:MAG TPA: hypothetical protein ENK91_05900 [Bacteroidetes bacterium]|nr:hypothetical protein [Bacteroidota bacterium]